MLFLCLIPPFAYETLAIIFRTKSMIFTNKYGRNIRFRKILRWIFLFEWHRVLFKCAAFYCLVIPKPPEWAHKYTDYHISLIRPSPLLHAQRKKKENFSIMLISDKFLFLLLQIFTFLSSSGKYKPILNDYRLLFLSFIDHF